MLDSQQKPCMRFWLNLVLKKYTSRLSGRGALTDVPEGKILSRWFWFALLARNQLATMLGQCPTFISKWIPAGHSFGGDSFNLGWFPCKVTSWWGQDLFPTFILRRLHSLGSEQVRWFLLVQLITSVMKLNYHPSFLALFKQTSTLAFQPSFHKEITSCLPG